MLSCAATNGYASYDIFDNPSSSTLFPECDKSNLKPGTSRSSLCDVWDEHISMLEEKLESECKLAGEKIYRIVSNVDGVYLHTDPNWKNTSYSPRNILHEYSYDTSRTRIEFIDPTRSRFYREIEYLSRRDNKIEKIFITKIEYLGNPEYRPKPFNLRVHTDKTYSDKPTQRYQLDFSNLTDIVEQKMGFHGDLTRIIDRKTNEILAERKVFYYIVGDRVYLKDGTRLPMPGKLKNPGIVACKNYNPNTLYDDYKFPKSEYEFASRVLIPTPFDKKLYRNFFEFSRGVGEIKDVCGHKRMKISPDIQANDLHLERKGEDLVISVKNGNDRLTCIKYDTFKAGFEMLFVDGTRWDKDRINSILTRSEQ